MSSLFGDLDVASAEDDPFKVPEGTYQGIIGDIIVKPTKDGTKTGMTIIYKITDGDHVGKNVREWKEIPTPGDPKNPTADEKRAMSFLKSRLMDLGVPESRVNSVKRDDLLAKEVTFSVKDGKNGFVNVGKVTLLQDEAIAKASGKTKGFK